MASRFHFARCVATPAIHLVVTSLFGLFLFGPEVPIEDEGLTLRVASDPFPVAPDLGGERSLAETDQRHRLVFNGIWQVGYGFQVSGIYFYGSGQRTQAVCGCDARGLQIASVDRLRLDGTIIPREAFVGQPIHRVELRLQERVPLHGRAAISGYLEVFNVFNRANYGPSPGSVGYVVTENSPQYGQPTASTNLSYAPRTVQLGFRVAF